MSRRTHDGFYHAGYPYFVDCLAEFLLCLGELVGRSLDAEFFGGQTAYALAVHGQTCRACRRRHIVSLFFKFHKHISRDCFHVGNDMVGFLLFNNFAQCGAVKHIEHIAAVCYLHGRGIGIFVAGYHLHAIALQFNRHFLAELSASQQHRFFAYRCHHRTYLYHFVCDFD